jgi:hypothetical protein
VPEDAEGKIDLVNASVAMEVAEKIEGEGVPLLVVDLEKEGEWLKGGRRDPLGDPVLVRLEVPVALPPVVTFCPEHPCVKAKRRSKIFPFIGGEGV